MVGQLVTYIPAEDRSRSELMDSLAITSVRTNAASPHVPQDTAAQNDCGSEWLYKETLPSAAARNADYRSRNTKVNTMPTNTMPDQGFGTLLIVFRMRETIW